MAYLFPSESVSEGRPDKVADQISDALLDQFLAYDEDARYVIGTFNTTGRVVIMGEVGFKEYVGFQTIACRTVNEIGYTKAEYQFDSNSCGVPSTTHKQNNGINRDADNGDAENQGADDQGTMFDYTRNETDDYMPVTSDLTHLLMATLAGIRKGDKQMTYPRPDSKSQVTVRYNGGNIPQRVDTVVASAQHDDFIEPVDDSREAQLKTDKETVEQIHKNIPEILIPRVRAQMTSEKVLTLFNDNIKYLVNPTGKFVIGGPHGDTGLTGRKIIIDIYSDKDGRGGGTFSGKDSSKVGRSIAYTVHYITKNMVAAGSGDGVLAQLAYAIGVAEPVSAYVNTHGRSRMKATDGEIAEMVEELFDLHPKTIKKILKLRQPMYLETAAYGHMGRQNEVVKKAFESRCHEKKTVDVELFTWEKLDRVEDVKRTLRL